MEVHFLCISSHYCSICVVRCLNKSKWKTFSLKPSDVMPNIVWIHFMFSVAQSVLAFKKKCTPKCTVISR